MGGTFDADRHSFINFTAAEVQADLDAFVTEVRALNPDLKIILTVSPVPLVATATEEHVVCATTYSKSVLRVAAGEAARAHDNVVYFPSYEIVAGIQAPENYFQPNRITVSSAAVKEVMRVFLGACDKPVAPGAKAGENARSPDQADSASAELSAAIAEAECEEAMVEGKR